MPDTIMTRVVVAFAALLALAVFATHPRVRALEERLGLTVFAGLGLPFFALGAFFALQPVGVLTPPILADLQPAFEIGLGWIGFSVGLRVDLKALKGRSVGIAAAVAAQTVAPMLTTALLCVPVLLLLGTAPGTGLVRNALVLMACAAATAPLAHLYSRDDAPGARDLTRDTIGFDDVMALALLGLITIYFRPDAAWVRWHLSPAWWAAVALGLGLIGGALVYVVARLSPDDTEELALLVGAVALTSGLAGYLALSVPAVCALAGALVANLPGFDRERVRRLFAGIERPLYLLFLVIVGASWRPAEWQGWLLALVFVAARSYGKSLGARLATRCVPGLPEPKALTLALLPQGEIAVVVIASAATLQTMTQVAPVRWAINAVVVGSLLTELVIRAARRRYDASAANPPPARPAGAAP